MTVVPVVVYVLGKKPKKKTGESGALLVEMEFSIRVGIVEVTALLKTTNILASKYYDDMMSLYLLCGSQYTRNFKSRNYSD